MIYGRALGGLTSNDDDKVARSDREIVVHLAAGANAIWNIEMARSLVSDEFRRDLRAWAIGRLDYEACHTEFRG